MTDSAGPTPLRDDELPDIPRDLLDQHPDLRRVGARMPLRDYGKELWRRREFALTVPLGELKAQNQDTTLGQLWHLLNPLLLVGVYYFIFGIVLGLADPDGGGARRGVDNYLPFLIVGVIVFNFTRSAVQSGARMIVKNRKLVQSISFPRAILPISSITSELISHLYAIPVMLILIGLLGEPPLWTWLLLPVLVVVQALFTLGIAMAVARFAFHFRDVQNVMPYLLRVWFYMSGVLFPITADLIASQTIRRILYLNPIWSILEAARDLLLHGRVVGWVWGLAIGWTAVSLLLGFWYFRRAESEYGRV